SARRRGARSDWRAQRAAPTPGLSRSLKSAGMIDGPEQHRTEVHGPGAAVTFLESDWFPGQHLADEQSLAMPNDFAGLTDHAYLPVIGVHDLGQTRRIRPRGGPIHLARRAIADSFMRPLLVVNATEGIEALLLRTSIGCWRLTRVSGQGAVQALVTAILLW